MGKRTAKQGGPITTDLREIHYYWRSEMRICDVIETIAVDQLQLGNQHKSEIIKSYSDHDWNKAILEFLRGIGSRHSVSGKIIYEMTGISNFFRENGILTHEQKWFVLHTLIENWDQISCESRAQLML